MAPQNKKSRAVVRRYEKLNLRTTSMNAIEQRDTKLSYDICSDFPDMDGARIG